ncbi:hypothetical protein CRUP_017394 [Coryphaenoides rupestris]|nr:hypothetical protein CRUP_017394 [Coryphaenoides rupestris]
MEVEKLTSELESAVEQRSAAVKDAHRYEGLLGVSNVELKKLRADMELERNGVKRQSDELRQETVDMKKSIQLFQDQIKALQRDKYSLEQKIVFHNTEVEGLKEQLKINRGKISRLNSVEQENDDKMQNLEDELSAKQAEIDQLKAKCRLQGSISIDGLIKAKLLDKDVLRRLEMGLTTVEVEVAQFLSQPKTIAGVYLESTVDRGLLTKATLQSLYEPLTNPKRFHDPCTGQKAHYGELLNTCVYDVDDSVYLLPFPDANLSNASPTSARKWSVISSLGGTEMSAYAAYKAGDGSAIETAISQRFLETTELASYRSGSLSIYELVDLIYSRMVVVEDVNSPVAGLWDSTQRKLLSVLQAFQENLIDGVTALRLLEAQVCTGGILDPTSGEKATLKQALSRGLVGGSFARQLSLYEQAYHGIVQPKTGKRISVAQAIQENLFPKDIGMRCLEFQLLTGGLINPKLRAESPSRKSLRVVFWTKAVWRY